MMPCECDELRDKLRQRLEFCRECGTDALKELEQLSQAGSEAGSAEFELLDYKEFIMKIRICAMNNLDDIRRDGTATLWWMKDGGELNEEMECTSICDMLTTKELFEMVVCDEEILVDKRTVNKYCAVIEQQE